MGHELPPTRADMRAALSAELRAIADAGRLRTRPVIDSPNGRTIVLHDGSTRQRLINWASNDYLGALGHLKVRNGAFNGPVVSAATATDAAGTAPATGDK